MSERQRVDIRRFAVICIYCLVALYGVVQVFVPEHGGVYYFFALAIASCATIWTVADAQRRGHTIVHIVQFIVFLAWPVAVPIYLIWSRHIRGLGLAALHALGLLIILYVFCYATYYCRQAF